VDVIAYDVPGWGVGELYLKDGTLLYHELPRAGEAPDEPAVHPLAERVRAHFRGEAVSFDDVELDLEWATHFQRAVAETLRTVPRGEVVTYGELAALAGYPNAQRAAGSFCAGNRFPLVVPCHRVVSAGGIGSYGSLGLDYKRRLLALEGVEL
jgi:O-6-methylguanine DNA methyltransferase